MKPLFEDHNRPIRTGLRVAGFILLPVGAVFLLIGLVDFFSAFGGAGFPTKFWCAFVGLPLTAAGAGCLQAGYARKIGTYVAGESVPVVTESAKHLVRELRPEFGGGATSRSDAAANDSVGRMKQLNVLKEKGLISESEYNAKRAEILEHL
ncbi:MAG: SHOCT domain-containing protein [Verrucomicrobia bacterium]|nr:SHOCT domain-containing protein [Verrucomicrobiota bacterium]MCH8526587.1 SHOCT domain-containing protein [Kiritimatiellia bacterium]